MTYDTQGGEAASTSTDSAGEERLLAAQVDLIMAVPPLAIAVRFVETVLDETERMIGQIPADISASDLHGRWKNSNVKSLPKVTPFSRANPTPLEVSDRLFEVEDRRAVGLRGVIAEVLGSRSFSPCRTPVVAR